MKIMPRNMFNPNSEKILENEVRIHKQLDHPNIIKLHEYFIDQDRYYLVMELCKGGELYQFIKEKMSTCRHGKEKQVRFIMK